MPRTTTATTNSGVHDDSPEATTEGRTGIIMQLAKPIAPGRDTTAPSNPRCRIAYGLRRQRGFSVIGWLLAIPLALIVLLILVIGFYEGRKAYWDSKVREMCAKDGGTRVHERVTLTKAEYDRLGGQGGIISIPSERQLSIRSPFVTKRIESIINDGIPRVYKVENLFVRNSDQKVLAISTRYVRTGGDFPTYAHPSSFLCPDQTRAVTEERAIFSIERGQ